jgi:phage gp16-like protein
MSSLAKIHIAKKQFGLDEDTYRAKLRLITGKESTRDMSEAERGQVLEAFKRDGFVAKAKNAKPKSGPAAKAVAKIEALWLSGWNLGVIDNASSQAMEAFILRQTGIAKAQWLTNAADAYKVIEALKAWLARTAGVVWSTKSADAQQSVLVAQIAWLAMRNIAFNVSGTQVEQQQQLGHAIRAAKKFMKEQAA